MRLLPILIAAVFLGTGLFFFFGKKIVQFERNLYNVIEICWDEVFMVRSSLKKILMFGR